MTMQIVQLRDTTDVTFATAAVVAEGDRLGGTIDLASAPAAMLALFEEWEEVVNGQMFSFLDEVQAKLKAVGVKAVFTDGSEAGVEDLQVFPGTGDVSFRLSSSPAHPTSVPDRVATNGPLAATAKPARDDR